MAPRAKATPKEKTTKIVMPVGVDAGKTVTVSVDQADRIKRDFGEWNGKSTEPADAKDDKALADALALLADETSRADTAEAKVAELEGLIAELTKPEGSE